MTLEVNELSRRYGTKQAVTDVSFALEDGEIVGLLGPSGCGKTTIVQMVAGHTAPDAGSVVLRGTDVTEEPPERRDVGVVFQQSTLYPHMTVRENVRYGLDAVDIEPEKRTRRVEEFLELVELEGEGDSYPGALSGGQKRRVELARVLAPEPDMLLLDEPLSALDRSLRTQLREEIVRIQRETGVTTLFVTHDQEDAMSVADRLVILNDGRVAAVGEPRELYESPPNRFVASFLGRSNTLPASDLDAMPPDDGSDRRVERQRSEASIAHVRPADLVFCRGADIEADLSLSGTVRAISDIGSRYDVEVELDVGETVVVEERGDPPTVGEAVTVGVDGSDVVVWE
ncbi:MAG: ABC transporter ATP-binding protein [Natronomonas sp.]